MLTVTPSITTRYQSVVLTVMPDPLQSTLTGRLVRYAGPASLPSNRPCLQLCRPLHTHFQPAVVTYIPDHPHPLPICRADSYAGPSSLHSNRPVGRYAGPASLLSNRRSDSYSGPSSLSSNRLCRPICQIILTPLQPDVLTVTPAPPHSLPTGIADRYDGACSLHSNRRSERYAGNPHYFPNGRSDYYVDPSSLHSTLPTERADRYAGPY